MATVSKKVHFIGPRHRPIMAQLIHRTVTYIRNREKNCQLTYPLLRAKPTVLNR